MIDPSSSEDDSEDEHKKQPTKLPVVPPGTLAGGRPSVRGKPELPRGSTAGLPGKYLLVYLRWYLESLVNKCILSEQ
ncbi:unnamed protein product [Diatraea saccharalis]|uniref:Uncharacterized protein n=1 Tax=Diatraea saccharalis TaxID=40085 RepID=A0A9N9RG57_9NEOP|nr:unnamed protein product [Diatraea saccharalis]